MVKGKLEKEDKNKSQHFCVLSNTKLETERSVMKNFTGEKNGQTRVPRWPCIVHLINRQVESIGLSVQEKVQYRFSRWQPSWISIQSDFCYF